jgi:hypothetical protein
MALRKMYPFKQPPLVTCRPDNVMLPPPALEELEKALNYPDCGVFVFWGLYQSGKTETLQALQAKLQEKGRRVEAYNAAEFVDGMKIDSWFLQQLTCIPGCSRATIHLNSVLPEPIPGVSPCFSLPQTTFIIDHFDTVFLHESLANLQAFVVHYAQQSNGGKRFNLLLCVSSASNAELILAWNGRRKIHLAA